MSKRRSPFEDFDFQAKVLGLLMRRSTILEDFREQLRPEMFCFDDIYVVAKQVFAHFDKYGKPPDFNTLKRRLKDEKKKPYHPDGWAGVFKTMYSKDLQPIADELKGWIQYSTFRTGLKVAIDHFHEGDYNRVASAFLYTIDQAQNDDEDLTALTGEKDENGKALSEAGFTTKDAYNAYGADSKEIPVLHPAALYGIAGKIVKAIEPHSESHPAALLIHLLLFYGNIVGRGPHWMAEATRHGVNLFAVLVGETSRGRKGTAKSHIASVFKYAAPDWIKNNIVNGLSTGEGLLNRVRDKEVSIDKKGNTEVIDPGVTDKRLLVVESEFSQVLKVMSREGNTLSPKIRGAWDDGNLATLTRTKPLKATGAHISIIGHITRTELLNRLREEDAASGLGNRFLWVFTTRTKELPSGGDRKQLEEDLRHLTHQLRDLVLFAMTQYGTIERDEEAEECWQYLYSRLTRNYPGLFGAITARAEAQVMRLASIYALLDKSVVIRIEHLGAAYAVWKYCEDSARYIFGDSVGDPIADAILKALRGKPKGLSRNEIRNDVFQRHRLAGEINRGLKRLIDYELIVSVRRKTKGRPVDVFFDINHFMDDPSPDDLKEPRPKGFKLPKVRQANKVASDLLARTLEIIDKEPVPPAEPQEKPKKKSKASRPPSAPGKRGKPQKRKEPAQQDQDSTAKRREQEALAKEIRDRMAADYQEKFPGDSVEERKEVS